MGALTQLGLSWMDARRLEAPKITPMSDGLIGAASMRIMMSVGLSMVGVGLFSNEKSRNDLSARTSERRTLISGGNAMMKYRWRDSAYAHL